jgi:photosystem II stability/assembly factor-like uncharacterized protein
MHELGAFRMKHTTIACCLLALVLGPAASAPAGAAEFDSNTFGSMRARSIGPAAMGGRIAALDAQWVDDKLMIWIGAATGGVWKSHNGGTTFKPVFDEHTQSIGAVTIDDSNPDVVWVGTGETWTRNSVSIGDGVYRTKDGGDNWEHLGLADTERINEILIHPEDSDTVWVCATGHLWDANEERGVLKTTDGGKTWNKVLYVDADTGCGDIEIDPQEPDILYAGMWQFRRYPWFFESGGPGSGMYRSTDGGETWAEVTEGLPAGEKGRIAVAAAPSRPNVVYATVESENTAMYRSDDLGKTWTKTGTSSAVEGRPFYFSLLLVDPTDHERIYKPGGSLAFSEDGGKTFGGLGGGTHADHHALWIDAKNPQRLLLGTDGGLYMSDDRGVNWTFRQNLPLSQFYQVSYDMERPYNVYGGLQDNGTWMGPTATPSGVQNKHWNNIGFGDGFHAYVEKADPDIVYVEWQGGRVERRRKSTGESKSISPLPGRDDPKLRFNWNTALHPSPTRENTLYVGAQFLFRSRDRGDTWERISPDLTTDDPAKQDQINSGGLTPDNSTAENHCSIYTIAESPLDENVIWVGTDDGNLQVTRDGGGGWSDVTGNVPGLPANTWVTQVEASPHDPAAAYATFDGHRTGDRAVYVYKTTDYGQTWTAINEGVEGYALVIRQDPVAPGLLYLGTEFGLYISIDDGATWARFKNELPKVGVRDLHVHPREHDLIVGTHGRGIYIVDDIIPLRQLNADVLGQKVALLDSRPAVQLVPSMVQEFPGDDEFVGSNPFGSARLTYYMSKRHIFGDLKIEVYGDEGELLTSLPGGKQKGINRVVWNMRLKPPKVPPAMSLVPQMFSFLGPSVPEGSYDYKLIKGKDTYEGTIEVQGDPRADYTPEDKAAQDEAVMRIYRVVERLTYLVDSVIALRDGARQRAEGLGEKDKLAKSLNEYADDLDAFRKTLVATRKGGFLAGEEQLREKVTWLYGSINGYEGRPTTSQLDYLEVLAEDVAAAETKFDGMLGADLDRLNGQLERKKLDKLARLTKEEWEAQ